jgi:hypothetical protein
MAQVARMCVAAHGPHVRVAAHGPHVRVAAHGPHVRLAAHGPHVRVAAQGYARLCMPCGGAHSLTRMIVHANAPAHSGMCRRS